MSLVSRSTLGLVVALSTLPALCSAQLPDPKVEPIVGAHSLALNFDGSRLAFVYRGDIWVVPTDGGRAYPVTTHVALDDDPVWSPDGKWIAFSSSRNGGADTYVVPAEGGAPRQITWQGLRPGDWSPDGKRIVTSATIDKTINGIYEIDVASGRITEDLVDMRRIRDPRYSDDGTQVVYEREGFPWYRPRYSGSAAAETWSVDRSTGKTKKWFDSSFQQLWPTLSGKDGSAYAVSVSELTPSSSPLGHSIGKNTDDADRTPNVYEFSSNGKEKRLTSFVGGAVRFLTRARKGGLVAFTHEGHIYTMRPGRDPKEVEIMAGSDSKTGFNERLVLTDGATDGTLSPDGSQIAFVVHDDVFLVPTKKGEGPNKDDATQLTDWAGLDRNVVWAPDGKHLFYTSDVDGAERLYRMDTATKESTGLSREGNDVSQLSLSPDKKFLYFYLKDDKVGGIYRVAVDGDQPEVVVGMPFSEGQTYAVSPDGRYIAYSYNNLGTLINETPNINLFVYDTQTKVAHQVTDLNALHVQPAWSPDGNFLFFNSDRDGSMAIYVLPLQGEKARVTELDKKYKKPDGAVTLDFDFNDTDKRIRRLINQAASGPVQVNPETGDVYYVVSGDLWKADYSGEGARKITNSAGIRTFEPDKDWSKLFALTNGKLATINIKSPQFPLSVVDFRADWLHKIDAERHAAFAQFWRAFNSGFYDPNMHGRDWLAIRKRYEPLLSSVGTNEEFANVLNMMTGELESSHSEIRGAPDGGPRGESSAHPGFTIDWSYAGPGLKVLDVPDGAPGSYDDTRIKPGEIVLKIDGKDVKGDTLLFRDVLNGQGGRDLTLSVSPDGLRSDAREVKYRALSSFEFRTIDYENRIRERRKYVEEKSGGKLTYIHIAGMGGRNMDVFNREAWEYAIGKKGMIIDVRDNGGGNIADALIDMIERKPHAIYQTRDGVPGKAPGRSLDMPLVVMMAETSYSNAEMFPAGMKARGLATLVGVTTPGYVIWTSGLRLVDGTSARMPNSASYRIDGSSMEDNGQKPDYFVDITREEYLAGKDPQLDKAIQVLMDQISGK